MLNKYKIVGDTLIVYNRKDNREMLFDTQDFDFINQHTWFIDDKGYVGTNIKVNGKYKNAIAHRLLMNTPVGMETDHRNSITTDNRKKNLLVTTKAENMHNRKSAKGYIWNRNKNRWMSYINFNNKRIHLGYYDTEHEARAAYLEAKKKYHPTAPIHLYT